MTVLEFALSICTSLIASLIFIFLLLFFLRPKFRICVTVSEQPNTFDKSGGTCYVFKVVNLSFFSAYAISVELSSLALYPVKNGHNYVYKKIALKTSEINFVAPYRPKWIRRNYADYAMLFITFEDLSTILGDVSSSIKIQVTARHGLTGLSKVHNMDYVNCSDIQKGHFSFGKSITIV